MTDRFVYLAGPITGMTLTGANDWREDVDHAFWLASAHQLKGSILGVSPLRCEPIVGDRYGEQYGNDPRFGTSRAIASKNLFDVQNCDMMLAYLPKQAREEAGHISSGTLIEIGWANALRKPIVLVSDDEEAINHPVINAACGWVLDNLDDAVAVAVGILGGYTGGKNV